MLVHLPTNYDIKKRRDNNFSSLSRVKEDRGALSGMS